MLIKSIIVLLTLYDDPRHVNFKANELAQLQMAGLVNDNNELTPQGEVIVQEVISFIRRVV
jgi:hypothetical protein